MEGDSWGTQRHPSISDSAVRNAEKARRAQTLARVGRKFLRTRSTGDLELFEVCLQAYEEVSDGRHLHAVR